MNTKKILFLIIVLTCIFKVNMVVRADAFCKYTNEKDCLNHNKVDNSNTRCEWVNNNGTETCRVKCSNYTNQNSCDGFKAGDEQICKWFKSDKKCRYIGTDKDVDTTVDNGKEECEDRKTKDYCLKKGNCRWDSSKDKCVRQLSSSEIEDDDDNDGVDNDNIDNGTYSNYESELVDCGGYDKKGNALISGIPRGIPKITHLLYLGIEIAVPIVLIILGMIDLFKGLSAQKDEEIKKGQQIFLKRLLAAAIIFFVLMIVKLIIGFAADSKASRIIACVECFIEEKCSGGK